MKIMMTAAAMLLVMTAALGQDTKDEKALAELQAAQEVKAARNKDMVQREVKEALARVQETKNRVYTSLVGNVAEDVTVNLEIENATLKDALNEVFKAAKREYTAEGDLPGDARISLKAKNVKLGTALDLITQAAGMGWTREMKDGKTIYRVGKGLSLHQGMSYLLSTPAPNREFAVRPFLDKSLNAEMPLIYSLSTTERMSTFTCPHCHGKVTMMRSASQPRCPKCGRVFQADWQFCPADGTKRPASPGAFKYCPLCGKPIEVEKPAEGK